MLLTLQVLGGDMWWTAAPNLTPVAAWDASRVSGAQLLDGVGDNHITATSELTSSDYPFVGVAGNSNPMTLTTPVPIPSVGVVAGFWSPNSTPNAVVLLSHELGSTSGYMIHISTDRKWYTTAPSGSGVYGLYGDIGTCYFAAIVTRGADSILYVNGNLVGDPVNSSRIMSQIAQIGYGGNGNPHNFESDEFLHAIGVWTGEATQDDVKAIEAAARLALKGVDITHPQPVVTGTAVADEYIDAVVSLLHFDGGVKDVGSIGAVDWNVTGDMTISDTGALYKHRASRHYISIPSNRDLNLEAYDYTVELWVYPTSFAAYNFVISKFGKSPNNSSSYAIGFDVNGGLYVTSSTGGNCVSSEAGAIVLNAWQHLAMVRIAGTVRFYVNGIIKGQWVDASYIANSAPLVIGADLNGEHFGFTGYVDEVRITKGVCRYPFEFTPERTPFADPAEPRVEKPTTARAVTNIFGRRTASIPQYEATYDAVTSKLGTGLSAAAGIMRFGVPQYPNPGFSKAVKTNIGWFRLPLSPLLLRTPEPHRYAGGVIGRIDVVDGGSGRIMGRLLERGVPKKPIARQVKLLDEVTGIIIRSTWSDPETGEYVFNNMNLKGTYSIIAYDYTGVYRAVIANGQKATKL